MSITNGTPSANGKHAAGPAPILANPTRRYRPSAYGAWWGYPSSVLDGTPFFTWWDVPRMLRDPQVRFVERMWRAPFQRVKWTVKADSRRVAGYVDQTLRRFWTRSLPRILSRYFRYGFAPAGAEFRHARGLVRLDRVRSVEPRDATPRLWARGTAAGQLAGFAVSANSGTATSPPDTTGGIWVGCPHAFWFAGHAELTPYHDMPPIAGTFEPWAEKRGRNGAIPIRRLWFRKCAFRGGVLYHPVGTSNYGSDESPDVRNNQDVAREILEYAESGSVYTFENVPNSGLPGEYAWKFDESKAGSDVPGLADYPKDLDREMLVGAGIPPEVLEAADVGSGWSGRLIPLMAFLGGVDEYAGLVIEAADPFVRHAVAANFGRHAWFEVEPFPLVDQVQQQAQAGKGGSEGANPVPGLLGQEPPADRAGSGKLNRPVAMSDRSPVSPRAARKARRAARPTREQIVALAMIDARLAGFDADELDALATLSPDEVDRAVGGVSLSWLLSWERYQGSYGGKGWKDLATGEIRYQEQMPGDGGGDGLAAADSKAARIVKAVGRVPGRVMAKVRAKVSATYGRLRDRYGPGYARVIVAAGVAGLPVPLPGASVMMAAPFLAVAELHRRLSRTGDVPETAEPGKVREAAKGFIARVFGRRAAAVELSWQPYVGPRKGRGWQNTETGKVVYGGNKPGERKERAQAVAAKARSILTKVVPGTVTREDLRELADHLPAMTTAHLRRARAILMASFGGGRRKEQMVAALLDHVKGRAQQADGSAGPEPEPRPADPTDPRRGGREEVVQKTKPKKAKKKAVPKPEGESGLIADARRIAETVADPSITYDDLRAFLGRLSAAPVAEVRAVAAAVGLVPRRGASKADTVARITHFLTDQKDQVVKIAANRAAGERWKKMLAGGDGSAPEGAV